MESMSTPKNSILASNRTVGPSGRNHKRPNFGTSDSSMSAVPLNIGSSSFVNYPTLTGFGTNYMKTADTRSITLRDGSLGDFAGLSRENRTLRQFFSKHAPSAQTSMSIMRGVSLENVEVEGSKYFEGTRIRNLSEIDKRFNHIIQKKQVLDDFAPERRINNTYEVIKKPVTRARSIIKMPKDLILQK